MGWRERGFHFSYQIQESQPPCGPKEVLLPSNWMPAQRSGSENVSSVLSGYTVPLSSSCASLPEILMPLKRNPNQHWLQMLRPSCKQRLLLLLLLILLHPEHFPETWMESMKKKQNRPEMRRRWRQWMPMAKCSRWDVAATCIPRNTLWRSVPLLEASRKRVATSMIEQRLSSPCSPFVCSVCMQFMSENRLQVEEEGKTVSWEFSREKGEKKQEYDSQSCQQFIKRGWMKVCFRQRIVQQDMRKGVAKTK